MRRKFSGVMRDGSGKIIQSGTVSVYLAGTTTAANIYAASSGGTAAATCTSDLTDGSFTFWVDNDEYIESQAFDVSLSKSGYTTKLYEDVIINNPYGYKPVSVLDYGATGNGTTDDEVTFETALAAAVNSTLYVPYGTYSMSGPIYIPSNTHIVIAPGTVFSKPSDGTDIGWFMIDDVENVTIEAYGVEFKYATKPSADEQRHIFYIRGGKNITILGAVANDSGGDGFAIGKGDDTDYSENIVIRDCSADNNRRQGMSIASAKNLLVDNFTASNTSGTSPQCGIDIEPNADDEYLENIQIVNYHSKDNSSAGLKINLGNYAPADKSVSINIVNHIDNGSVNGLSIEHGSPNILGRINIESPQYFNSVDSGIYIRDWDATSVEIVVTDPYIENPVSSGRDDIYGTGLLVYNATADAGAESLGGVKVIRPTIKDTRDTHLMKRSLVVSDSVASNIYNVEIENPKDLQGYTTSIGYFLGNVKLSDRNNVFSYSATGSYTENGGTARTTIDNTGASGDIVISLSSAIPVGYPDISIAVTEAFNITIDPDANSTIQPLGSGAGKYLRSNTVGNRIILRRTSATAWGVTNVVGTWTADKREAK